MPTIADGSQRRTSSSRSPRGRRASSITCSSSATSRPTSAVIEREIQLQAGAAARPRGDVRDPAPAGRARPVPADPDRRDPARRVEPARRPDHGRGSAVDDDRLWRRSRADRIGSRERHRRRRRGAAASSRRAGSSRSAAATSAARTVRPTSTRASACARTTSRRGRTTGSSASPSTASSARSGSRARSGGTPDVTITGGDRAGRALDVQLRAQGRQRRDPAPALSPAIRASARYTFSNDQDLRPAARPREDQATIDRVFPQVRLSAFVGRDRARHARRRARSDARALPERGGHAGRPRARRAGRLHEVVPAGARVSQRCPARRRLVFAGAHRASASPTASRGRSRSTDAHGHPDHRRSSRTFPPASGFSPAATRRPRLRARQPSAPRRPSARPASRAAATAWCC